MKKISLFLVFFIFTLLIVACGPRESKDIQSSQETGSGNAIKETTSDVADLTEDTADDEGIKGGEDLTVVPQQETPDSTVYTCVSTDTTTCGNRLTIPLQSKRKLTFTSVAIQGVDLSSLTVHLTFSPKDSGIQRIITEIPTAGKSNALSVDGEDIWNKYNADTQGVIRTFLATATIYGVLSLANANEDYMSSSLLSTLNKHLDNSPIYITDVNVSFDKGTQILVRIPVKKS